MTRRRITSTKRQRRKVERNEPPRISIIVSGRSFIPAIDRLSAESSFLEPISRQRNCTSIDGPPMNPMPIYMSCKSRSAIISHWSHLKENIQVCCLRWRWSMEDKAWFRYLSTYCRSARTRILEIAKCRHGDPMWSRLNRTETWRSLAIDVCRLSRQMRCKRRTSPRWFILAVWSSIEGKRWVTVM